MVSSRTDWSKSGVAELLCVLYISGVLTCIRNVESAIPGEVSFHFVFRGADGTEYTLQVYDQTTPARIDLQVGV